MLRARSIPAVLLGLAYLAVAPAGPNPGWAQDASVTPTPTPAQAPFAVPVATPGGQLPGAPAVQLIKVVDGLIDPVNVTSANDGSGRLFVVERIGRIRIVQDGVLLPEPFLDITVKVERGQLEQGLLGLAFDLDYETTGFFYV